jgi:hypothetical protein
MSRRHRAHRRIVLAKGRGPEETEVTLGEPVEWEMPPLSIDPNILVTVILLN